MTLPVGNTLPIEVWLMYVTEYENLAIVGGYCDHLSLSVLLGVVCLREEYTVCREGDTLTPEQAKLLVYSYGRAS